MGLLRHYHLLFRRVERGLGREQRLCHNHGDVLDTWSPEVGALPRGLRNHGVHFCPAENCSVTVKKCFGPSSEEYPENQVSEPARLRRHRK